MIFTGACIGLLALMPDFGMALILFATFLIIAFMRSGSVRTIALVLAGAVLAVLVSSGYLLAVGWMQTLFAPWNFPGWLLAAAVLSVALARELALTKKGVEEAWNLSFER